MERRQRRKQEAIKCSREISQVLPVGLINSAYQEATRQHRGTNWGQHTADPAKAERRHSELKVES